MDVKFWIWHSNILSAFLCKTLIRVLHDESIELHIFYECLDIYVENIICSHVRFSNIGPFTNLHKLKNLFQKSFSQWSNRNFNIVFVLLRFSIIQKWLGGIIVWIVLCYASYVSFGLLGTLANKWNEYNYNTVCILYIYIS